MTRGNNKRGLCPIRVLMADGAGLGRVRDVEYDGDARSRHGGRESCDGRVAQNKLGPILLVWGLRVEH